jgi:hypothetical protein
MHKAGQRATKTTAAAFHGITLRTFARYFQIRRTGFTVTRSQRPDMARWGRLRSPDHAAKRPARNSRERFQWKRREGCLDRRRRKGSFDNVDISQSARKHGVDDEDIVHAWENAIRYVEYE